MSDASDQPAVLFEQIEHVAVIKINRPEARNAINGDVAAGLEAAVDRLEADPDLWVGVLTGTPPVFSAGADLKEIQAGRRASLRTERGGFAGFVARQRTKPVIAAVEGPAMGGGLELCLACDLIVASTDSRFGVPEVKRALVAAAGGLFRLPRKLPTNVALEMVLTGEPIDAARAEHFGLVNHLAEPTHVLERALELAAAVAANGPVAVRASRRVILATDGSDEAVGFALSNEAMAEAMASEDAKEGVAAFVERRPPRFTGA